MQNDSDERRSQRGRWTMAVIAAFGLVATASSAGANGLLGLRTAVRAATPHVAVTVTGVHREDGADKATLSFDLSASVEPSAFVLAGPDRAVVDLPQVDFALDPAAGKTPPTRRRGRAGLVGAFRFGLVAPGRSRIVVDLAEPARVVAAKVVQTDGKSTLVLSLARTDAASFKAAARSEALSAVAAPAPVAAAPPVPGKSTIVLDPGHGGPDTGAIVNGVVEKDVALAFAKMLASKLEASGQFNVVMTRASDVFIPLSERVHVARSANAALMVSIHCDTLPETGDVGGATVYTVSDKASDAYAAKVAAKENDADAAGGVERATDTADVNDILFDLTRQETRAYSHVFARTLVNYWKVAGRLNKNPQRSAGFVVLKAPDVPSVLVELGYLSNAADSSALTSEDWRGKATDRMAAAIESYFADRRGPEKAAAGVPMPLRQAIVEGPAVH